MRSFATFKSGLPDDTEFTPSGDVEKPGGQSLARLIAARLAELGLVVSDPVQHSFYGWAFTVGEGGRHYIIIQFASPWLLQACVQSDERNASDRELSDLLQKLHSIISSDGRFANSRWFTKREYDACDLGAEAP